MSTRRISRRSTCRPRRNLSDLRRYRSRPGHAVTAVQLKLDTEGFTYRKWGDLQRCKPGDWLVDSLGDVHTVDDVVFRRTYVALSEGRYRKVTPVWARRAPSAGSIVTKEGRSHYRAGDYLVYNEPDGADAYCMSAEKFDALYEQGEEP